MTSNLIYIKYLPKAEIIYNLWVHAKYAKYADDCIDKMPTLYLNDVKKDLLEMEKNKRDIELTLYYGKMLFININGDYLNPATYDSYNGYKLAKYIICQVKIDEISKCLCKTVIFN